MRIVFAEQFSADLEVWPAFRTAVFMQREDVVAFSDQLALAVRTMALQQK
jgi:hypothetical protein